MSSTFPPAKQSLIEKLTANQLQRIPQPQPLYYFQTGTWHRISLGQTKNQPKPSQPLRNPQISPSLPSPITSVTLLTWNIDFMAPHGSARLASALNHLATLLSPLPSTTAVLILLQEMTASDLKQLSETPWIRAHFAMTDRTPAAWDGSSYGTVTLVDRRVKVARAARLRFVSEYQRDGLGVDVVLQVRSEGKNREDAGVGKAEEKILRVVNVHLDSMASNPPMRPLQMAALGRWVGDGGCVAGVVAGDMNANREYDRALPTENGFKDAYLELGGIEGAEEGMTWGFQSEANMAKRFGPTRLDKVVFSGEVGVKSLTRIGMGVVVEDEAVRAKMKAEEEVEFVTDHYGLIAEFSFEDGVQVATQSEEAIMENFSGKT